MSRVMHLFFAVFHYYDYLYYHGLSGAAARDTALRISGVAVRNAGLASRIRGIGWSQLGASWSV